MGGVIEINANLLHESQVEKLRREICGLEFDYSNAVKECERLRAESDSLRNALAERNAKYWTLCDEVERLFKTIEGEKREGGR